MQRYAPDYKMCRVKLIILKDERPGDIDTLIAEYWSVRERADDTYVYFSAIGTLKGIEIAYLLVETNDKPIKPLERYTDNNILQGAIVRDFVNRHYVKQSQLNGFALDNLITCHSKLWGAYKGKSSKIK